MIRKTLPSTKAATFAILLQDRKGRGAPQPTGTGFFVSLNGWFVTAAHVVTENNESNGPPRTDLDQSWLQKEHRLNDDSDASRRIFCKGTTLEVLIPHLDFALLKVDFEKHAEENNAWGDRGFPYLQVSSRPLEEGEPVYAFGYPLSDAHMLIDSPDGRVSSVGLRPRTTSGIVSSTFDCTAFVMTSNDPKYYIIDRALNFGNSGGPIVAAETGEVHAFCSSFQLMGMIQKHIDMDTGPMVVTVPSLYGTVVGLHNPEIVAALGERGVEIH